jgi:hypothetical protein
MRSAEKNPLLSTPGYNDTGDFEIFHGDTAMTFTIKPDRLDEFSESTAPLGISRNYSSRNTNVGDPLITAAQNRQTKLILEKTLAEARNSIRSATDIVRRRGNATLDTFLRHHLLATAREVAAIESIFEASLWPEESGPPCLVRSLTSEISRLESFYTGRIGPINKYTTVANFTPSWTAEIIFRLIARALIYDALITAPRFARLAICLRLDGEILRLDIDGAGHSTAQALMSRIDRPKHFKALLDALCGNLESRPNGIRVCMPTACIESAAEEDTTPFWP